MSINKKTNNFHYKGEPVKKFDRQQLSQLAIQIKIRLKRIKLPEADHHGRTTKTTILRNNRTKKI